ncbi:hypothetical protein SAMN05216555_10220 [Arthrobacter cupressi]|uniref:Uncharacterized protein n=2 Tax=Arthrobacter cupressi TaxID=1045773 RepID=A0A1G8JUA3_9MICC|nr:hypothetical protein SAMN05216555_10220 [Arthrobacter cupressi]
MRLAWDLNSARQLHMPADETMKEPINTLAIIDDYMEWTESKFRWFRPRLEVIRQAPIHEFYVDGAPLMSLLDPEEADDPDRKIPTLGWAPPKESSEQLRQLLGGTVPADRNGRVWLLYCQCGDPGCGGVSTRIVFASKTVTWTDFRWDNIFGDPTEPMELDRTFVFERTGYEKLMHDMTDRFCPRRTRLA